MKIISIFNIKISEKLIIISKTRHILKEIWTKKIQELYIEQLYQTKNLNLFEINKKVVNDILSFFNVLIDSLFC